jgi:competence protein ComEC
MSTWLLPAAAAAFWAGILAWPALGQGVSPLVFLGAGLVPLCLAAATGPAADRGPDPLASAGLAPTEPPVLRAVGRGRTRPGRAPPVLLGLAVVAAFVLLGSGWAGLAALRLEHSPLASLAPSPVEVTGEVGSDFQLGPFGWSATAAVTEVRTPGRAATAVREGVWLEGDGRTPGMTRGDRFRASGVVVRPPPGPFRDFLARHGVAVTIRADEIRRLGPAANPLVRLTQLVRRAMRERMLAMFPGRQAGLLMGLALGDTSMLDPLDAEHFRATGLSHLLAVSGENVAMVLGPVLGLAVLLRLSMRARFALGLGTVVFFVVLTGAAPSVLRAGVMAGLALTGVLLGRPRSTSAILAGAVLLLLIHQPGLVLDIGFQLSVSATAGIVALSSPLTARLAGLPRPLALAAATTLAAQVGVSPLLLYHFHQVPEVTILANLLAFPAVAPAMLLGLAAGAVSVVTEPVGRLMAGLAQLPIGYLEGLADRLASAPFPSITSPGGVGVLVIGYGLVGAAVLWLRSGRRVSRRALVTGVAAILPLFVWSTALKAGSPSGLVVRFLDVGQGDAALVVSPGGASMLIDGGPDPDLVATKLAALGVKRLDAVVATHPHLDHYLGLPAVLARIPTGVVLDTGCHPADSRSPPYRAFLEAVRREGVPERHPRAGDELSVGDLRLELLSPDRCWHDTNSDANNDSLVIMLSRREDRVLFANEPEADAQQAMLDAGVTLTAQVLNVPHHGASTSIEPFFRAVHEEVAVVSVGPNTYGHPTPETLAALRASGARVFRTDRSGDVTVRFEAPGLVVETGRGRRVEFDGGGRVTGPRSGGPGAAASASALPGPSGRRGAGRGVQGLNQRPRLAGSGNPPAAMRPRRSPPRGRSRPRAPPAAGGAPGARW